MADTGQDISFGEPGLTIMKYCDDGENFFLNTIEKINKYQINQEGKLILMINDIAMMRFEK